MYKTWASDHTAYNFWAWQFDDTPETAGYAFWQSFGELEAEGDVDWWPLPIDDDSAGSFYQISTWPTYMWDFEPVISIVDEAGTVLAQSTDPQYGSAYGDIFSYPASIIFRVPTGGVYYVVVEDVNGGGGEGAGYFYPLMCSPGWYFTTDIWETEANHPTGLAQSLSMTESSSSPGFFYATFGGGLDEEGDESDNFMFRSSDTDGLDGKYLSVMVNTAVYGSLLDAKLTVYEDLGQGKFSPLTEVLLDPSGESMDDPKVLDLELENDNSIYIAIEHENADDEVAISHYYLGAVYVSDAPVW